MRFIKGNLLEANTDALVNTVNTVGVMGKGIALQFKGAFPNNYKEYVAICKRKELQPGKLLVVKESTLHGEKLIINFPTKTEWRLKSKYEYVEDGLKALVNTIEEYQIKSIAIPPLGCGNGGLKWEKVKLMIEQYLNPLEDVDIVVFEPNEAVKDILKKQDAHNNVKLTPARAMLLYALFYYETLGESSSLFVANKLAYFLKRLGEKSLNKLQFEASLYGPYSIGVDHMLHALNGKYLKGLEQMNVRAFEQIEMQYNKVQEVSEYIKKELTPEQRIRLKNLIDLIHGFQSALSLEILTTVDFIRETKNITKKEDIVAAIHAWSERKKKLFVDKYIQIAIDHLDKYSNHLQPNLV